MCYEEDKSDRAISCYPFLSGCTKREISNSVCCARDRLPGSLIFISTRFGVLGGGQSWSCYPLLSISEWRFKTQNRQFGVLCTRSPTGLADLLFKAFRCARRRAKLPPLFRNTFCALNGKDSERKFHDFQIFSRIVKDLFSRMFKVFQGIPMIVRGFSRIIKDFHCNSW